ncbi:MAG: acetylxylan esterase [Mycobacteriales bacterium]
MALFDFARAELETYQPTRDEQPDYDAFWAATLASVREHDLGATFTPYDAGLTEIETFDVSFAGWNGEPVKGWLLLPAHRAGTLGCVVQYHGYNGGRGLVHQYLMYAAAGYAHLLMDTRGQGGGDTGDAHADASGPHVAGYMTDGILDKDVYYYRRLMSDAVRAVETARAHPDVDPDRIVVAGGSQGGGLTLAAAGLVDGLAGSMPDVPFLCHYRRATEIVDTAPYSEIQAYCRTRPEDIERVFTTLSYFDGVNFAAHAGAPTLYSVGLMDMVCPPSTVYAAYNHHASTDKAIEVYPYNGHEGGAARHEVAKLAFVRRVLG